MVKKIAFEDTATILETPDATDRTDVTIATNQSSNDGKLKRQISNIGRSLVDFNWSNLFRKKQRNKSGDQQDVFTESKKTPILKSSLSWPQSHRIKILKDISNYTVSVEPEESKDWAFIDDESLN